MLNLLIAIISEYFADVNENKDNASYQERARMISENAYLIPWYRKYIFCPESQYLIMAEEVKLEESEADGSDSSNTKNEELIKGLKEDLIKEFKEIVSQLVEKKEWINLDILITYEINYIAYPIKQINYFKLIIYQR